MVAIVTIQISDQFHGVLIYLMAIGTTHTQILGMNIMPEFNRFVFYAFDRTIQVTFITSYFLIPMMTIIAVGFIDDQFPVHLLVGMARLTIQVGRLQMNSVLEKGVEDLHLFSLNIGMTIVTFELK